MPNDENLYSPPRSELEEQPRLLIDLAKPWPRYWARMFDVMLFFSLVGLVFGLVMVFMWQEWGQIVLGNEFLVNWLCLPGALVVEAICYQLFGNTPGKLIAGIKVRSIRNERVDFQTSLGRNFRMWFFGLGLTIPLISLITLVYSYRSLSKANVLSWDQRTDTRCFDVSGSGWRTTVTFISLIALMIGVSWVGSSG